MLGSEGAELLNINPLIVVIDNFLKLDQCAELIDAASKNLIRAEILDADANKAESSSRTNSTAHLRVDQCAIVAQIGMKIGAVLRMPISHAEQLQVLHYGVGQEFKPHHDGMLIDDDPSVVEHYESRGGQRLFSTMIYLNEVASGGATTFPHLNLSIDPKPGRLLIFANTGAGNRFMSNLSLHAGTPVEEGEKWSAITWWREQPRPEGKRIL